MPKPTKSDKPWLAYVVQEDHEGEAVVVYAQHRATAQNDGSCQLNSDFQDVRCRRAPEWDHRFPHGPDRQELYDSGWWMPCDLCYHGRAEQGCGGHAVDGSFYCEPCYDGFTAMRPIRHPSPGDQSIGEATRFDFDDMEVKEVPLPLSAYPLRVGHYANPYFWYSPFR